MAKTSVKKKPAAAKQPSAPAKRSSAAAKPASAAAKKPGAAAKHSVAKSAPKPASKPAAKSAAKKPEIKNAKSKPLPKPAAKSPAKPAGKLAAKPVGKVDAKAPVKPADSAKAPEKVVADKAKSAPVPVSPKGKATEKAEKPAKSGSNVIHVATANGVVTINGTPAAPSKDGVPRKPSLVQGTIVRAQPTSNSKAAKAAAAAAKPVIIPTKPIAPVKGGSQKLAGSTGPLLGSSGPTIAARTVNSAATVAANAAARAAATPPKPAIATSEKRVKNPHFNDKDLEFFRLELLNKRRELLGDMHSMEREALSKNSSDLSTLPVHMADQGTDAYEQEFTLTLVEKDRQLLRDVNDALAKIQNGTFGICEGTGLAISRARLEAVPWSRFSIEHQRALERKQMPFRR